MLSLYFLLLVTWVVGEKNVGNYRLVFEDNFSNFDLRKWDHEVTAWGGGNCEFQVYTPEKQNSFARNGLLFLKPTLTADKFGEDFLRNGVLDLWKLYGRCTNAANFGCRREGKNGLINPIMSAKVVTRQSWKYGKVEVMAKMPRGDWLWPAIWLVPKHNAYGGWPRSGEIDMAECRGNRNYGSIGIHRAGSTLHWGLAGQDRWYLTDGHRHAKSGTYADGFHKYVLEWDANGIKVLIDDQLSLNAPTPPRGYYDKGGFHGQDNIWKNGGKDAPFDKEFYLMLNVACGGTNGYFPDNVPNKPHPKPWKNSSRKGPEEFWNAKKNWYSTWRGDDAAMQVQYVKVWQRV